MKRLRANWAVGPFVMWRADHIDHLGGTTSRANKAPTRKLRGARITDEDTRLIYEAVVERADGKARLTGLTILTTQAGQYIDQDVIRRVPVQRIAEQVSLQLVEEESSGMAVFVSEAHRSKHDGPEVEDVAQDHRSGLSRQAIADKWKTSIYTIDKRLREARDRQLISPPTTGRPRSPGVTVTKPEHRSNDAKKMGGSK